jgi:hypothetical protein
VVEQGGFAGIGHTDQCHSFHSSCPCGR